MFYIRGDGDRIVHRAEGLRNKKIREKYKCFTYRETEIGVHVHKEKIETSIWTLRGR